MSAFFDSLKGKMVLVTGSSRGIGRAIALGFAKNGANVVLHGTKPSESMNEALSLISAFGVKYGAVYGDLADEKVQNAIIGQAVDILGGIDVLVLNASIQIRKPYSDITSDDVLVQVKTNMLSTVKLIQHAVPIMENGGYGRIIIIGSVQQDKPHTEMLIYSAIKSANLNIVKSLAIQLADKNITVNNVAVGTIYTDRNSKVLENKEYKAAVINDIPMKRIGNPEDCVAGVLLLASQEGGYITGENLHIDGGKFCK